MTDLPPDFQPKSIEYVDGDPLPYAITKDGRPMPDELKAYRQGWNNALFATDAANLRRERIALEAAFLGTLTGPNIGLSEATAKRIIDATLREARGEP